MPYRRFQAEVAFGARSRAAVNLCGVLATFLIDADGGVSLFSVGMFFFV